MVSLSITKRRYVMDYKLLTKEELLSTLQEYRRGTSNKVIKLSDLVLPKIKLYDTMDNKELNNIEFTNCDLSEVDFTDIELYNVRFVNCILPDKFTNVSFTESAIKDGCETYSGTIHFNSCLFNKLDLFGRMYKEEKLSITVVF